MTNSVIILKVKNHQEYSILKQIIDISTILTDRYRVVQRVQRRERRRDAATACASERERATSGHIWSRGPRGSQVTLASDGASRFHVDVLSHTHSPPSIWESSSLSLPTSSLLCRGPKIPTVVPRMRERRGGAREDESRREALFRDYRGLSAFWNRADRLHSPISSVSSISRVLVSTRFLRFWNIYQSRIFVWDYRSQFVDCKSQRLFIFFKWSIF